MSAPGTESNRFVVATAGHVDHGKSALVRALTGTEPDRWEEEQQRGLTIDLGFAELTLDSGKAVSFVDVPGHERFIGNMLAGLGPAPVVCLVVAADEGWAAQTSEHRDAIAALGISTGLVVISRADLAPENVATVTTQVREQLAHTALAQAPVVVTSAVDGTGLADFRAVLDQVLDGVAPPNVTAPIRYWVDRAFAVKGAGTVVTGTLAAGTLAVHDTLELTSHNTGTDTKMTTTPVTVRNLQSHGSSVQTLTPVTRAAVNLRGVDAKHVSRGDVLIMPEAWFSSHLVDVVATPGTDFTKLAQQFSVHIGTATVTAHCRPLSPGFARLTLNRSLPLRIGDRLILRGTGKQLITGGASIVDLDPPVLRRRGAARRRAELLALRTTQTHLGQEVARRGAVVQELTEKMGIPVPHPLPESVLNIASHWVDAQALAGWVQQLTDDVVQHHAHDPAAGGMTQHAAVHALQLPVATLLPVVVQRAALAQADGKIFDPNLKPSLGAAEAPIAVLEQRFDAEPFTAPTADELAELGLTEKILATAHQQQRILRLADSIVVGPKTPALAMRRLSALEQPFTAAQARQALGTTRRTLIPLLEHLDARGWTQRVDGTLRKVTGA